MVIITLHAELYISIFSNTIEFIKLQRNGGIYVVTWKIQDGVQNGFILYLNIVSISRSRSKREIFGEKG